MDRSGESNNGHHQIGFAITTNALDSVGGGGGGGDDDNDDRVSNYLW